MSNSSSGLLIYIIYTGPLFHILGCNIYVIWLVNLAIIPGVPDMVLVLFPDPHPKRNRGSGEYSTSSYYGLASLWSLLLGFSKLESVLSRSVNVWISGLWYSCTLHSYKFTMVDKTVLSCGRLLSHRMPFSNVRMHTSSLVSKPKTTVIGLGTRLVHARIRRWVAVMLCAVISISFLIKWWVLEPFWRYCCRMLWSEESSPTATWMTSSSIRSPSTSQGLLCMGRPKLV